MGHARRSEIQQEPRAVPIVQFLKDLLEDRAVCPHGVIVGAFRTRAYALPNTKPETRSGRRTATVTPTAPPLSVPKMYNSCGFSRGRRHRDQLFGLVLDRRRNSLGKRIGTTAPLNIEDHWAAKSAGPLDRTASRRVLGE